MIAEDRIKVQEFIESLGYEGVRLEEAGVMDFGRIDVVIVQVKRAVRVDE